MAIALINSNNNNVITGLLFVIYNGYNENDVYYGSKNKSNLYTYNGKGGSYNYGYVNNLSDIITGTNQYIANSGYDNKTYSYGNFNITYRQNINNIVANNFSVQWLGYFKPNITTTWKFILGSDDNSFFWIGNNAISNYTSSNANISAPFLQSLNFI